MVVIITALTMTMVKMMIQNEEGGESVNFIFLCDKALFLEPTETVDVGLTKWRSRSDQIRLYSWVESENALLTYSNTQRQRYLNNLLSTPKKYEQRNKKSNLLKERSAVSLLSSDGATNNSTGIHHFV